MAVTLPPALARLDPDTLDAVLALAVEIVTAPQPVGGLTRQQAHIVRVLQAAGGRWVSDDAMAQAVAPDPANPPMPISIGMQYCHMRGKPLRDHIERAGPGRGKRAAARWVG